MAARRGNVAGGTLTLEKMNFVQSTVVVAEAPPAPPDMPGDMASGDEGSGSGEDASGDFASGHGGPGAE